MNKIGEILSTIYIRKNYIIRENLHGRQKPFKA